MTNFKAYFYNQFDFYRESGTFTWTKPSDLDETKPILVHVWGAGGKGANSYDQTANINYGGGGGGLAVKLIDVSALSSTETITVGARNGASNGQGGSSSFGSHCSATGANGGLCVTANEGLTGYGVGGLGLNGDVNKRGGRGGAGYWASNDNSGGGGGGSAPAPYGYRDGFKGGDASTYSGGGGGSIGSPGGNGGYVGGAGGGTMNLSKMSLSSSSYFTVIPGGNGLLGTGGAPCGGMSSLITYGGGSAKLSTQPTGDLILTPNEIACYGGGGNGHIYWYASSERNVVPPTDGAPGGGGGGCGKYTTTGVYFSAGAGGFLGGGGGTSDYSDSGAGGNAGGSGGTGYYNQHAARPSVEKCKAGNGVVIVQYARLV